MLIRNITWALSVFFLTSCGFQPMLSYDQNDTPQKFVIKMDGIDGYFRYKFKQELLNRLRIMPHQINEPIEIKINLQNSATGTGYGRDATVLRGQEKLSVDYEITSPSFEKGKLFSSSSYTYNSQEEFSTLNAKNAAQERIITSLAEETAREINFLLKRRTVKLL